MPEVPALAGGTKEDYRQLSGIEKSAILLMSIDEENASRIFNMMDEEEIKEMSSVMASLGTVSSDTVERLFMEFVEQMSAAGVLIGTYDTTERLLAKALGKDKVDSIMEDIRGPAGRTTWDKLGNVSEEVLATYLKNEYPQTIALVLSKVRPEHAAKVICEFSEDLAMEVMMRMLAMDPVKKEVLDGIEKTLRVEFMSNLAKTQRRDSHEMMAEIFNNFTNLGRRNYIRIVVNRCLFGSKVNCCLLYSDQIGHLFFDPGSTTSATHPFYWKHQMLGT